MTLDANGLANTEGIDALRAAADGARLFQGGEAPQHRVSALPYRWREDSEIPPRPWVYGQLLMRGTVSATVAPGGVGKTSLLIGESLAMATGKPLLGEVVHGGPKRVWLWNLEEPEDELTRRIQAAARHWSICPQQVHERLFVNAGPANSLLVASARQPDFVDEGLFVALEAEILDRSIDVLILDPFVSSHALEENDNVQIDRVVKRWSLLAQRTRSAVHIIHHTRKTDGAVTSESARGAKGFVDAARTVRVLNPATQEDLSTLGLQADARAFCAHRDKQNMAAGHDDRRWYLVRGVSLENGPPADEVGVVLAIPPPSAMVSDLAVETIEAIQSALAGMDRGYDQRSGDWAGYDIAPILGLNAEDKPQRARTRHALGRLVQQGFLVRADAPHPRAGRMRPVVRVGKPVLPPQCPDGSVDECASVET